MMAETILGMLLMCALLQQQFAIKHNLYVFENLGGHAVIIQQFCREETTDGIFFKYTHILKGNHVSDHYNAIVDLELPQHPVCANS